MSKWTDFMQELEAEAAEEGTEAQEELEVLKKYFSAKTKPFAGCHNCLEYQCGNYRKKDKECEGDSCDNFMGSTAALFNDLARQIAELRALIEKDKE